PTPQPWGIVTGTGPAARRPWSLARAPQTLVLVLATAIVLYALQATYSQDLDKATETAGFFLAPFALMTRQLLDAPWTHRLFRQLLAVVAIEAVALSLIAFVQLATHHLFWNHEVIVANEFHRFFRVNSLFWDPNIFGRFLSLAILAVVAAMLWARSRRTALAAAITTAILWVALVLTFSQSSLVALLAGLVVLAALRWSVRWTAVIAALAAIAALVYLVAFGSQIKFQLGSEKALDKTTSGRADLVRGGIELARRRPVLGFGSGSFVQSFRQESKRNSSVAASHTEPVTIAAEQGAVGIVVYLALLAAALTVLVGGLRGAMPGWPRRGARAADVTTDGTGRAPPPTDWLVARAAVAAAFVAMIVHSMTYAAFLTDPLTWALLAFAVVLSAGPLDSQLAPQPARRATGVAWLGPSRA
ncbi:MAG: hypothetical protein QOG09_779, partial [Solirubrobacterales bacterium]|nr:hypothetical protein [Solirubrobacterales bacterium]